MTRRSDLRDRRGYFAVGIEHGKTEMNIGTLWRTADIMGAAFLFTVGRRYQKQASDTRKTWRHVPLMNFATLDDLVSALPFACPLVGIELDDRATPLVAFRHPERACYLLGAEDHGLTSEAIERCHALVRLPGEASMNVAVAGSIVLYDRVTRGTVAYKGRAA